MTINYNVTGAERKRLAQALGEILRWEPVYTKAPAFAYVINKYTIDKNGVISCPDSAMPEEIERIIETLKEQGFVPQDEVNDTAEPPAETPDVLPEVEDDANPEGDESEVTEGDISPDTAEETEAAATDDTHFVISLPRSELPDDALGRLRQIVANKEALFKRALLTDSLTINVTDDEVSFPWFTLTGADGEANAYSQFITALCRMAKTQTRILDKPYDGDNDKFAMRIFMVRLGMKGSEYALARKLMMKNLTGNSGWRYGAPPKMPEADNPTEISKNAETETVLSEE